MVNGKSTTTSLPTIEFKLLLIAFMSPIESTFINNKENISQKKKLGASLLFL